MADDDLPPIDEVPAAHLEGRTLGDGWVVITRVRRDPGSTGGCHSVPYLATHEDGTQAFLKALNFNAVATAGPGTLVDRLNHFTEAYIFERDLFAECGNNRLSRVVRMLAHGEVIVQEAGPLLREVPYLIFEMADGDIRSHQARLRSFDAAWALRAMKHVIEGVDQLHSNHTAHQDLKPSNVLTQEGGKEMKLGDLGRADRRGMEGPWSAEDIPGALIYAPPEQQYGSGSRSWEDRRAADVYLAGSLGAQLFLGHCMSALLQEHVQPEFRLKGWRGAPGWYGTFEEVVPALEASHAVVLEALLQAATQQIGHADIAESFTAAIGQMTNPDPARRGHPKDRAARTSSYSLKRFVGTMNTLSAQADHRLVGRRGSGTAS